MGSSFHGGQRGFEKDNILLSLTIPGVPAHGGASVAQKPLPGIVEMGTAKDGESSPFTLAGVI